MNKILESNNFDFPYDKQDDKDVPEYDMPRKKVLSLMDINRLKKIRNKRREELAQDSVYIPILFGSSENPDNNSMGGF